MYNKIITLGYNCEPSLQVKDFFGDVESSVFSWTYSESNWGLIKCLENVDKLIDSELVLTDWNMYKNNEFGISWHGENMLHLLYHSKDRTPKDITEDEIKYDVSDIQSKLVHLIDKFKKTTYSEDKVLYIYKMLNEPVETYNEFTLSLYNRLKTDKSNFDLLIVDLEENRFKNSIDQEHISNLYLDFYPPDGNVHAADSKNWKEFFNKIERD